MQMDRWTSEMKAIVFPALEEVGGGIEIDNSNGPELVYFPELIRQGQIEQGGDNTIDIDETCGVRVASFPKLEVADVIEIDDNDSLECVDLSSLKSTGSRLNLDDNVFLKEVRTPNLETVGDGLDWSDSLTLTEVNLPKLTSVGDTINFSGSIGLKKISAPLLETVPGDVDLGDVPSLDSVDFGSLTSIRGLTISQSQLSDLNAFSNLSGESGISLSLLHNAKLTSADALATAVSNGVFTNGHICDNPLLASLPSSFSSLNPVPVVCAADEPPCDCSF
uniref:Receptor L-domain domain-containing protein n=1 Tax=Chromera velia CCMP2878 TaxID=1169474 RepID=A0A0G4GUJ9_9ALVE|eukprot:Cvel_23434.t1-p1 / transcript=Cvel_23434.t1 / gene=Cvel_23434 / organism=Chromera_velia_CCMP2878 / gene_product=hypothetical protein / transcript_product=hypothetical protein / location=Cvel_scaffold2415:1534-2605(+) / protein_length=277 / sequence_SO=supercontig / SO=protein_coding / is_pseudo=false